MSDTLGLSDAELQKLKVADLKKLLKERGLSVVGNKPELIARLQGQDSNLRATTEEELLGDDFDDDVDTSVLNEDNEAQLLSPSEKSAPSANNRPPVTAAPAKPAVTAVSKPQITMVTAPGAPTGGATPDKMGERLKRFGVVSQDAKKLSRAERFGTVATVTAATTETTTTVKSKPATSGVLSQSAEIIAEQEKLRKRSERFGVASAPAGGAPVTVGGANKLSSNAPVADVDTLKKRAERFGQQTSTVLTKASEQEKIMKRKNRFGTVLSSTLPSAGSADDGATEAKKIKRAERFGLAVS